MDPTHCYLRTVNIGLAIQSVLIALFDSIRIHILIDTVPITLLYLVRRHHILMNTVLVTLFYLVRGSQILMDTVLITYLVSGI